MTVENGLDPESELDPMTSTPAFFGAKSRIRREEVGLSRGGLARRALRAVAGRQGGGGPTRFLPVTIRNARPAWFRPFVGPAHQARAGCSFESRLVPGVSQAEERARAVPADGRPDRGKSEAPIGPVLVVTRRTGRCRVERSARRGTSPAVYRGRYVRP